MRGGHLLQRLLRRLLPLDGLRQPRELVGGRFRLEILAGVAPSQLPQDVREGTLPFLALALRLAERRDHRIEASAGLLECLALSRDGGFDLHRILCRHHRTATLGRTGAGTGASGTGGAGGVGTRHEVG